MDTSWMCSNPGRDGRPCPEKLTKEDKFCPECGKVVVPPPAPQHPTDVYTWPCQNRTENGDVCGKELNAKKKFCGRCGALIGTPICRHCFLPLEEINTFCDECGKKLMSPANQTQAQQKTTSGTVGSAPAAERDSAYQYESSDSLSYQDISLTPGEAGSQESAATGAPAHQSATRHPSDGVPGQELVGTRLKACTSPPSDVLPSVSPSLSGEPLISIESESEYAATTEDSEYAITTDDSRTQTEDSSTEDDTDEESSSPPPIEIKPIKDGHQSDEQQGEPDRESGNSVPRVQTEETLSNKGIFSRGAPASTVEEVAANVPTKRASPVFGASPETFGRAREVSCGAAMRHGTSGKAVTDDGIRVVGVDECPNGKSTRDPEPSELAEGEESREALRTKRLKHFECQQQSSETRQGAERKSESFENKHVSEVSIQLENLNVKQEGGTTKRLHQIHGAPSDIDMEAVETTHGESKRAQEVPPCALALDSPDGLSERAHEVPPCCGTKTPDEEMPAHGDVPPIKSEPNADSAIAGPSHHSEGPEAGAGAMQDAPERIDDAAIIACGPGVKLHRTADGVFRANETEPSQVKSKAEPANQVQIKEEKGQVEHSSTPPSPGYSVQESTAIDTEVEDQRDQGPERASDGERPQKRASESIAQQNSSQDENPSKTRKTDEKPPSASASSKDPSSQTEVAYNKKETTPENYIETRSKKKNKNKKQNNDGNKTSDNCMVFHFHVIVDAAFKFTKKHARVYVLFGPELLGGFNQLNHELDFVRDLPDGSCLLTGDVKIPVQLLRMSLQYKYCLIREGSQERKWEFHKKGDVVNRVLKMDQATVKSGGFVHQYDGIMLKKHESGWVKSAVGYITGRTDKDNKKLLRTALNEMMPPWEGFCLTGKDASCGQALTAYQAIEHIENLKRCLPYWPLCEEVADYTRVFKEVLKEYIQPRIEHFKDTGDEKGEVKQAASLELASAVAVVVLTRMFEIDLGGNNNRRVMSALQIRPDKEKMVCHDYNELVSQHFPGHRIKGIARHLKMFIKDHVSKHNGDYRWLKCVPLLHFLEGKSRPFEVPDIIYQEAHTRQMWWGTEGIQEIVNLTKSSLISEDTLKHILELLDPLYEVDFLLPRTILACLCHRHIESVMKCRKMPIEAILAMLFFHLKTQGIHHVYIKNYMQELQMFISKMSSTIPEDSRDDMHTEKTWWVASFVCLDLLHLVAELSLDPRNTVGKQCVILMINISVDVMKTRKKALLQLKNLKQQSRANPEMRLRSDVLAWTKRFLPTWLGRDWIHTTYYGRIEGSTENFQLVKVHVELDLWSDLMHVELSEEMQQEWKNDLQTALCERLSKTTLEDQVTMYRFCVKFDTHHKDLIDLFNQFVFTAAQELMRQGSSFLQHNYTSQDSNVLWMFSQVFMKIWPVSGDQPCHEPNTVLKHILTMPALKQFLDLFKNEAASKAMTEECRFCLGEAQSLLFKVVEDLASGDIVLSQLKIVLENPQALVENATVVGPWFNEVPDSKVLSAIIEQRKAELNDLHECKGNVNELLSICRDLGSVDGSNLEKKLGLMNMDKELKAFCNPTRYDPEKKEFIKCSPTVTVFKFTTEVEIKLMSLLALKDSEIYMKILKETGRSLQKKSLDSQGYLTVDDLFEKVWPKAEQFWLDITKKVQEGTIALGFLDNGFKDLYGQWDVLERELSLMFPDKDDRRIKERLTQIKRYSTLAQYEDGAHVILETKERLNLTGDFGVLERILGATTQKSSELRSITEDVVKAGQDLTGMNPGHVECIKAFSKCEPLVSWIREHVKRLQELKTLVDLALISAVGQGDLEVTKVSCLHAAVSGFAPLIYDLEPTAGFREFYQKCEDVWRAYDADSDLPKKLVNLSDELEWLKGVKEAQGDVEVNALKQVAAINSRGIYIVGNHTRQLSKSFEDIIQVRVPPEDQPNEGTKGKLRVYSLSDLKELQSKLMLVAGKAEKGNDEVDSFVEKFDGVTGLANTFVNLCTAGNILFKTWTAKFYCDPSKKVNAVVDFGLSDKKLTGQSFNAKVSQQISQVREFMEQCLKQWREYIEEKRAEFPELNHYTTEQLVILRSELITSVEQRLDDKVLALLHDVHPDCTMKDLHAAFKEATKEIKAKDPSHLDQKQPTDNDTDDQYAGMDKEVIQDLLGKYTPQIVQRAIEKCTDGHNELDYICMELEEQEQDVEMQEEDDTTGQALSAIQRDQTMGKLTDEFMKQLSDHKSNLRETLEKLWSKVFESSSMSGMDYLSIEHLGIILKHLARNDALDRTLPPYLKEGRPNLIVCPEGDILLTVVSVYMENENLPLPTRNEVLLCNESTSPEEVELLIRRAVSEDSRRIFMLVGAHLLNYEVAGAAERAIDNHTRGKDRYRLAVVCSSEQQDHSRLVTALDNYRVHTPVRPQLVRVRAYIQNQLQGGEGEPASACRVDPDNCCVRVVKSDRAGTGKSLWMKRKGELLKEKTRALGRGKKSRITSMPLFGRSAQVKTVLDVLLKYTPSYDQYIPSLYHINVPHEMQDGVDHLLFNLVVLGSLVDPGGYVWRRNLHDLYVIEILPLLCWETGASDTQEDGKKSVHHVLEFLPCITCRSPQESLQVLLARDRGPGVLPPLVNWSQNDQLIDEEEFHSVAFQRVYQYLKRLDLGDDLRTVDPHIPEDTPADCLQILLRYCGLEDPTWAEMVHFVRFLNVQLTACESSCFCTIAATSDDTLPGFLKFVVRFMIQMSRDFSTRSLNMAEETQNPFMGANARQENDPGQEAVEEELVQFQLKRLWETSPHPYIFFNPDQVTMTFLGFVVSPPNFDIIDPRTSVVLEEKIMTKQLFDGLSRNRVNLSENFDRLARHQQIEKLCMVMGNEEPHDPDDKYVLTADNAKKILAIQMRFRCNIPVVIMGETGCGKTYLIKFMCSLQCPPGQRVKNMLLMKVHGGTTEVDLIKKVKQGQELAKKNRENFPGMHTVLFLDEVNTTEALGLVKEVLCDHSLNGQPLGVDSGLRLIAACNPYRKHSQEVIEKLEQAGLGYHVTADQTSDKLGRIPMRRLVYRVQPLPQSLLPLVWDFGQLPSNAEMLYIHQIVRKKLAAVEFEELPANAATAITNILVAAQTFMREQQDECSFVSLRDVERTMEVMNWFYTQRDNLFKLMDEKREAADTPQIFRGQDEEEEDNSDLEDEEEDIQAPNALQRALILALGVCYHACLQEKRREFREAVNELFEGTFELANGPITIEEEISACQDVFLDEIELGANIAKNQALKENVFMMVVCIELRIPLFLVGKPGSSKSLAKTIVADAMQGPNSRSPLFKKLKQAYMVSYQCSPLSTPDGIVSIFQQCGQLQKDKGDLDKFVAVVVLDEIGLAEDSPRMPLKALHPLLEDGCEGDDEAEKHKKVGFIGISNWALDPAKMNRGILVQRGSPDAADLEATARDICATDKTVARKITPLMRPLAMAYSELYEKAIYNIREFYGLRDFYSLVKMVYGFAQKKKQIPTWEELQHAILRNFGGLESMEPVEVFSKHIEGTVRKQPPVRSDPDNTPGGLIHASLCGKAVEGDSRYLLVLTENYAALPILQQNLEAMENPIIIFGSSFPKDQDYVVVCRNINRIKVCMETGQTVVLLNLESLYESLYDALNQYYTYFGGQRHVDLGLGSHRVKSRVHPDFKLIVVAEKDVVYKKFPIPLINRLEKHFVAQSTMLTRQQQHIVKKLSDWAENMAKIPPSPTAGRTKSVQPTTSDIFIGYHRDTCATVVLQVCFKMNQNEGDDDWASEVLRRSKDILLQCATPEAIVRVCKTPLRAEEGAIMDTYFKKQQHDSLIDYLKVELDRHTATAFLQVTTHSRLLSNNDVQHIARAVGLQKEAVNSQMLQAFNTEQQFSNLLRKYFTMPSNTDQILLIQCDSADKNAELIACARFIIREQYYQAQQNEEGHQTKRHVIIIVQLPRVSGGCFVGFQGGLWQAVHLDDLRAQQHQMPPVAALKNQTISGLVKGSFAMHPAPPPPPPPAREESDMDVDEDVILISDDEQDVQPMVTGEPEEVDEEPRFDYNQLLKSCVHGAAAMLRDKVAVNSTARVHKLLALLQECLPAAEGGPDKTNEDETFREILKKRIYLLLKDKEDSKMIGQMARDWLSNDVASVEAVNKAGTFRRSLWQYLEMKITPILAGIIAFVDTNHNMSLIGEPTPSTWNQRMWLSLFNNVTLTQLTYDDLVSAKKLTELKEMTVQMKGAEGTVMTSRLPFSWLLKSQIDILVNQHKKPNVGEEDITRPIGRLLKQSPWWPVLEAAFAEGGRDQVRDCYLEDYVRMVYKPQTKTEEIEYELVKGAIAATVLQLEEQDKTDDTDDEMAEQRGKLGAEHALPIIHIAEAAIHSRLQLFSEIIMQNAEVIDKLQNHPDSPLTSEKEMVLDVLAVHFVVESIQPTRNMLRNKESSREWQDRVEMTSPLVNAILARANTLNVPGVGAYSKDCVTVLKDIWSKWNQVTTVKMFVEIVCPEGSDQEKDVTKHGPAFFKKLEGANFKTEKTMKVVEEFLKFATKMACRQYTGEAKQCPCCGDPMTTSVVMPCGHEVCEECTNNLQQANDFSCFECKSEYPEKQKLKRRERTREQVKKLQTFKQRCNLFLTELVSRMCFAGTTPPEAGVVDMLMGYITGRVHAARNLRPHVRTKEMNIFNDRLDPTPVVRSVLLQLLLRSSVDQVHEHLVQYFNQARDMVTGSKDMIELAVLYIQCLEDHYFTVSSATASDRTIIGQAIERLEESNDNLQQNEDQVAQLEGIAQARFGLSIAADWLIMAYVKKLPNVPALVQRLFRVARVVCSHEDKQGPCVYLIRQIVRRYSFNELQEIARSFPWVIPEYAQQNENDNLPDQFVVWGTGYRNIRDLITQTMVNDEMEPLTEALSQRGGDANQLLQHVLLGIFREVTLSQIHDDERRRPSHETIQTLQAACQAAATTLGDHNAVVQALLVNDIAKQCPQLKVSPDLSNREIMILEVVVHFMISITTTNTDNLLNPIASLATNPASMAATFLPTMPADERTEIHEALLAARNVAGNDPNPSMYECPNGHPYIIGNCGRPAYVYRCNQCGAPIGGQNYRLSDRNRIADVADRTRPGHCLGPAANRSLVPAPERTMSPACTALIRLLVHLGLYVGANTQLQAVLALIHPDIREAAVPDFLWEHLMCDLEVLSRAVGKGMDDTLLLVHLLIRDLAVTQNKGHRRAQLTTRKARTTWETEFSAAFVTPLLNELDDRLNRGNEEITGDVRQDNNVLRRLIHESDAPQNEVDATTDLDEVPAMWRFRTRVSIGHLTQALSENIASHRHANPEALQRHQILHLFLEKEALLRAVRYIPRILQLLKVMSQFYHRKIDRSEADTVKVKDFLKKIQSDVMRDRCEALFVDFRSAWTTVHAYLQTHGVAGQVLPPEYCNQKITDETPISTFLPSLRGRGLCCIALLHYLTTVHNNFMAEYLRISKKQARPEVSFQDLTQAHLIHYDPDRDLLPMVLANCTYSLEVGHGTKIEYNFRSLEQQLQERFIKGKAMLVFQLEPISFREDLNNAVLFRSLEKKIPQEPFSSAIQNQIRGDAHYMVEVSDCLSHLDIAIGFLVSVGGDPETLLDEFMTDTLQMETGTLTPRARQHCKLCHTQALWLLFSHEREKMAIRHKQEPFTSVDSRGYGVELTNEDVMALERVLPHMNVDHFLNELHECIVMHITIKADPNDEDFVDNKQHKLAEIMYAYIDSKDGTNITALTNGSFPADIKVEQCVETWRVACKFLQQAL